MRTTMVFVFFLLVNSLCSQEVDYFHQKREYHYKAIYINTKGDTISNEKLIIKPLGKPWVGQPRVQTAVKYIYANDSNAFRRYVDPDPYFRERNLKFDKKGKMRINQVETTGGVVAEYDFYMHPPRTNQYRMLFYAPHFWISFLHMKDTVSTYISGMIIPMTGRFIHHNAVLPMPDTIIEGSTVKAWQLIVTSTGDIKERFKAEKIYNSKMDAIFTKEYGFVKVHYTFENGIKIQFDLEKVVEF
ncbi:MAG: hypothetical protein RBR35_07215 [Salinivirgaceae bacterium]|nr:hypothetical protein [Salinivirgaceae bacterium]